MAYSYCCKNNKKESIHETLNNDYANRVYLTKQYVPDEIFITKPPCTFGNHGSCPCHSGGTCLFIKK